MARESRRNRRDRARAEHEAALVARYLEFLDRDLEPGESIAAVTTDAHLLADRWWKILPDEKRAIVVTNRRLLLVQTNPWTNNPIALDDAYRRADVRLLENRPVWAAFGGEGGETLQRVTLSLDGGEARFNARDARMVVDQLRYPHPG